jgi:hypothetical protein
MSVVTSSQTRLSLSAEQKYDVARAGDTGAHVFQIQEDHLETVVDRPVAVFVNPGVTELVGVRIDRSVAVVAVAAVLAARDVTTITDDEIVPVAVRAVSREGGARQESRGEER